MVSKMSGKSIRIPQLACDPLWNNQVYNQSLGPGVRAMADKAWLSRSHIEPGPKFARAASREECHRKRRRVYGFFFFQEKSCWLFPPKGSARL